MAKLHYCDDGTSITEQVIKYQSSRSGEDYKEVYRYYNNYKDRWYLDLQDHLDRSTFDSDYDYKLCRAVETFDEKQARLLCQRYKWSFVGAFNRWFYAVLRNWKSNIKTSAFRQKKRPAVFCPICGRSVPKIDASHLEHYKGKNDLPKVFRWKNTIFSVFTLPDVFAISWGKFTKNKLTEINAGNKEYTKERIEWPWYNSDGTKGVMCPFTKKIISKINFDYIKSLPRKYNRYARPLTWYEFIEEFPNPTLIQSEIYSLDHRIYDDDVSFYNKISVHSEPSVINHKDIEKNNTSIEYEHVFYLIETNIEDKIDQKILKLAAIGYSDEDISNVLNINKKDIRYRKKNIRAIGNELKCKLQDSIS